MRRLAYLGLALAATALPAAPGLASDHLVPEHAGLESYRATEQAVLKAAFDPSVRVRAVAEPSFSLEFAVGVREQTDGFKIFFLQPSRQLWNYTTLQMMKDGRIRVYKPDGSPGTQEAIERQKARLPADPKMLPMSRCEASVSPALARELIEDWRLMLERVAPKDDNVTIMDGETIRFAMGDGGATGETQSPDAASQPGMLVAVVYAMRDYCRTPTPDGLSALEQRAGALRDRLRTASR